MSTRFFLVSSLAQIGSHADTRKLEKPVAIIFFNCPGGRKKRAWDWNRLTRLDFYAILGVAHAHRPDGLPCDSMKGGVSWL